MKKLLITFLVLVLALALSASRQQIRYVRPIQVSPSTCSSPCLTLDKFREQAEMYFTNGATFLFLAGNHSLQTTLSLANLSGIEFIAEESDSDIIIITKSDIACSNTSNFTIEGIIFRPHNNSVALTFENCEHILVSGCSFEGDANYINSNVTSTQFSQSSDVAITNCNFERNAGGAVILVAVRNVSIISSSFADNVALAASAISAADNSTVDITNCLFQRNTADLTGGAIEVISESTVTLHGNTFIANKAALGGALFAGRATTVNVEDGNVFLQNSATARGGAVFAIGSTINVRGSARETNIPQGTQTFLLTFANNTAGASGGAIGILDSRMSLGGNCTRFRHNSANFGGALHVEQSTLQSHSENLYFTSNTAKLGGGAITFSGLLSFNGNTFFYNNSAGIVGGAIFCGGPGTLTAAGYTHFHGNRAESGGAIAMALATFHALGTMSFTENRASINGGAFFISNSDVIFNGYAEFFGNSAVVVGGGMAVSESHLEARQLNFTRNTASGGGGIFIRDGETNLLSSSFISNTATDGGAISIMGNVTLHDTTAFNNSNSALWVSEGTVILSGTTIFSHNHFMKRQGGGILGRNSRVIISGHAIFDSNRAKSGGAIVAFFSTVSISGVAVFTENHATEVGGGLYAVGSEYVLNGTMNFTGNSARIGGAVHVNGISTLSLEQHTSINTRSNSASEYGGFMYYEDNIVDSITQCDSAQVVGVLLPSCFIKLNGLTNSSIHYAINSYNDTAGVDGSFLYGGVLGMCQVKIVYSIVGVTTGIVPYGILRDRVFHIEQIDNETDEITSKPYNLCFCESNDDYNCSGVKFLTLHRGQKFWVPLVALAQWETPTMATVTAIVSPTARLELSQSSQVILKHCTNVSYNLYSTAESEQLVLYPADGPCHSMGLARAAINVTLMACPDAFMQTRGQCVCELRLQIHDVECLIDEDVYIARSAGSNLWMGFLYDNGSYQGLILQKTCPVEYCKNHAVNITLYDQDIQCEHNRGGLSCGACAVNYSLVLGTSQCQICSNNYALLVLPFAAAGILLVMFLSAIRLTVATGMINSIILYANIVQVNKMMLLPATSGNILTVFIAWLNLDFGFQSCFYHGLDAYAQTWLQYAFPLYIWILISLIIVISRYSVTVSKLIGHNPIAVLATLLLMSYAKILKKCIPP